jgi:hypothetical protein
MLHPEIHWRNLSLLNTYCQLTVFCIHWALFYPLVLNCVWVRWWRREVLHIRCDGLSDRVGGSGGSVGSGVDGVHLSTQHWWLLHLFHNGALHSIWWNDLELSSGQSTCLDNQHVYPKGRTSVKVCMPLVWCFELCFQWLVHDVLAS